MNRSNQLSLDLPEYEVEKEECYANYKGKYTVDISQIYRFYIAVNSIGTLIKTKEKLKVLILFLSVMMKKLQMKY